MVNHVMVVIDINPFRITSEHLINIHTGRNADPEVHYDLTNVENIGMKALSVSLNSDKKPQLQSNSINSTHTLWPSQMEKGDVY